MVQDRRDKIARMAEAASYASRAEMVRQIETRLRALRQLADFWARFGRRPHDEWVSDVQIELSHFAGMDAIAWSDPASGARFFTSAPDPVFDHRPDEEEWALVAGALDEAHAQHEPTMVGPFPGEDGRPRYRVYVPVEREGESAGVLIAVADANATLESLLRDEAPGYAITVLWDGTELHQRGEPAPDLPPSWTREGWIQLSMGPRWQVVHRPTRQLAADLASPAVAFVLAGGLAIAALLGALVFENGRAASRARAAEAAEGQVRAVNVSLERRVAERTGDLEAAVSDLETFNQSVSHDLRSPVGAILIQADLLREDFAERLGEAGTEHVDRIRSSAHVVAETLERLLGLSRASRGPLERERVDVGALAAEVFEELRAAENGDPVQLAVAELPPADADPVLLRMVLTNLIGNALKFTRGRESRHIEVVWQPTEEGDPAYGVRDDGQGFDPADAERVFRPFERLSGTNGASGTGLGLAICRRIVVRHGGRIWAESEPGKGAAFWFTLG